ncbi:DUF3667 domain-containing protein [Aquimarina pacifica]|uniref:DUF3667 domain-containing protein n=1 Tax=Aquimarina pacifica TaxID=1296415 RepID=UPI00137734D4|nr:DUF3667 domain-containing protein [Aquimarina pacifica]
MSEKETKTIKPIETFAHCKNCHTQLNGNYCHHCGQSTNDFQKPIRYLISEFAGNVFAFDTRFFKSIRSLLIKPGQYTFNFIQGRRVQYVPPFRFFVFTSFFFFFVLSIFLKNNIDLTKEKTEEIKTTINEKLKVNDIKNDVVDINLYEENVEEAKQVKEMVIAIINNPTIYMDRLLNFLSWSVFFLIPIYAFLLWLFFRKTQRYYFSHLILAINQHSFIFLFSAFLILIKLILPTRDYHPENYLFWLLPIYVYLGYLRLYNRNWFGSIFKSIAILFIYMISLTTIMSSAIAFWAKSEFL